MHLNLKMTDLCFTDDVFKSIFITNSVYIDKDFSAVYSGLSLNMRQANAEAMPAKIYERYLASLGHSEFMRRK